METPWGPLAQLDPDDRALAFRILSHDKHQLLEGLVVENTFDQILRPLAAGAAARLTPLDIETVVVDTRRKNQPWLVIVWARTPKTSLGLGRYLQALESVAEVQVVELHEGQFLARRWQRGRRSETSIPIHDLLRELSGREPTIPRVDLTVRDGDRQRTAFWGYLNTTYPGRRLWNEVVLPRLLINIGIQPFFRGVWNLDRICVFEEHLWMLEVKHKFPFGRDNLMFGINDGELGMMQLAADGGIRTLYSLIVKPKWSKEVGSMYLHSDLEMRQKAAVIGMVMDQDRLTSIKGGRSGSSPAHTSITGRDALSYKSIPARQFSFLGSFADGQARLASAISTLMAGDKAEAVSDERLRALAMPV